MNNMTSNTSQTSKSWDKYWQGTSDTGAFTSGGVSHPAIRAFWIEFFNSAKQNYNNPNILDIASGNGAVIECALEAFEQIPNELYSLDVSEAAINNIHSRYPKVKGIVSNANSVPKETGSFDIVTSQYGIEYAGHDAILEAARLLADSGSMVLLMHCDASSIHLECRQSLIAIERTQTSGFIQLAIEMFDAGFKSIKGADRKPYEQSSKQLAPAIMELESIMREYGSHVAGDSISRLYNDVGQIHQRIQHYESADVLAWLNRMEEELSAYAKRMSSMSESAINNSKFEQIKDDLTERGFVIETADKLYIPGEELPMAWVLIAKKHAQSL
jgi:ubiquinone/menaquinone biosynthesis C-methylase UbiE